jgi:lipopolysaccharide export system permease protein
MLQTFLPLFLMTFGICLFIVLMQFLWRYIDDMVGKGLSLYVLGKMFLYAALYMMPMALPLSILLASLMTFGNLGERLELLAMKSAGVSLVKIMKPIFIFLAFVSVGAFFFQNYVMPIAQVKLYTIIYSIRQKSPELEIPEGTFYKEIPGINVYVEHKNRETGVLHDLMLYDYSEGFNRARVIVADSGKLKTSANKMFLELNLYNGEMFENLRDEEKIAQGDIVPYRRETFQERDILIDFDENFNLADQSFLENQYVGKNLFELQHSIDSMTTKLDSVKAVNAADMYKKSYRMSITADQENTAERADMEIAERQMEASHQVEHKVLPPSAYILDSILSDNKPNLQARIVGVAKTEAESVKTEYFFKASTIGDEAYKIRRHLTEWHNKFTLSFACLVFFFIGAPLGAIIRKGGLGMPVVISVFLFIFYYIVNNVGFKMARDGIWAAWEGMWLSSAVLTPLGIFLTYKAVNDSVILNADTYLNALKNLVGKRQGRKIEMKEVIMYEPNYDDVASRLEILGKACKEYVFQHRRWLNYLKFWKEGGKDKKAEEIAKQMESIVEELSNSDNILVLNKLMDFPIISGYKRLGEHTSPKLKLAIGWFVPVGLPIYLVATYQRKLLRHDIETVDKTCEDMLSIFSTFVEKYKSKDKG